jgi:ribonuclease III family protein
MNYFCPNMSLKDVNAMSMLGLAHIGDGVYELLTRTMLCRHGHSAAGTLHRLTVSYVNAPAQARAVQKILPVLSESELAVYKRGRNAKVNSVPQKATEGEYHAATGLEALFGWLYLQGMTERIDELFSMIMEDDNAT